MFQFLNMTDLQMRRIVVTMMMPDRFRSIILGQLLYLLQLNCTTNEGTRRGILQDPRKLSLAEDT
jgi:hypothetical protein